MQLVRFVSSITSLIVCAINFLLIALYDKMLKKLVSTNSHTLNLHSFVAATYTHYPSKLRLIFCASFRHYQGRILNGTVILLEEQNNSTESNNFYKSSVMLLVGISCTAKGNLSGLVHPGALSTISSKASILHQSNSHPNDYSMLMLQSRKAV